MSSSPLHTPQEPENIPHVKIRAFRDSTDQATVLGLVLAFIMLGTAVYLGGNTGAFFNIPSMLVVFGGTLAVVLISFSADDFKSLPSILGKALLKKDANIKQRIGELLEISSVAKKHGILSLQKIDESLRRDKFLHRSIQLVTDGYTANDIQRILIGEIDALKKRHEQSANILYRASEVAPAMGLIGTLIALVQMLGNLNDPSLIGPSMSLALLTTFYGAILGTVILAPLASKLEKNSARESLEKRLVLLSVISIAKHEHPRRLEIQLNGEVSPQDRIAYFDKIKN